MDAAFRDDLKLALARHATSKISTLDDLEAIMSMGFVVKPSQYQPVSRLTLTSRTAFKRRLGKPTPKGVI